MSKIDFSREDCLVMIDSFLVNVKIITIKTKDQIILWASAGICFKGFEYKGNTPHVADAIALQKYLIFYHSYRTNYS